MLFPIKAICNPKEIRRDGTAIIFIQFCYSSENRTLLNTGIAIPQYIGICVKDALAIIYLLCMGILHI